jgi:hypothetical protein
MPALATEAAPKATATAATKMFLMLNSETGGNKATKRFSGHQEEVSWR